MIQLLETTLREASPLLYVALGATIAYRAGIYHLGVEGLMLVGAFCGVAAEIRLGSIVAALLVAVAVCAALSVLFWLLITALRANPIIVGIGLSTFCLGATSYALETMFGSAGSVSTERGLPHPISSASHGIEGVLSGLSILVWLAPLAVALTWVLLCRTRFGLSISAVGAHPFAARAAGLSPGTIRLLGLVVCGGLCAIGGADFALGNLQLFSENMTNGRGYIAFAAVLLARGNPIAVGVTCVFFGLADALAVQTQIWGTGGIPPDFVLMLPFVLTILAVWLTGLLGRRGRRASAGFLELRQ